MFFLSFYMGGWCFKAMPQADSEEKLIAELTYISGVKTVHRSIVTGMDYAGCAPSQGSSM
jgi:hypothetical protein